MRRTRATLVPILLSAAVLAAVALPGAAVAAADLPDLRVNVDPGIGTVTPRGSLPGMVVSNHGTAAATGVTLTIDYTAVDAHVRVTVPAGNERCTLAGRTVTCELGTIELDAGEYVIPMQLGLEPDAAEGAAGEAVVTVAADEQDAVPADNTARYPVTVVINEVFPDIRALVADLNTPDRRVGPGDRRPMYAAVRNAGTVPVTGFSVALMLPIGGAIVQRYRDCAYSSQFPEGNGRGFLYFPVYVECHLPLTLRPGETLPLFDPATRRSLFHAAFGRNLSGPAELQGLMFTRPEADPQRPDNGTGPSFSDAVRRLPIITEGDEPSWWPDLHGDHGHTPFAVWTEPNRFDIAVTGLEHQSRADDIAGFQFTLVNNGPSDSGALEYVVTAPRGTVLTQGGNAIDCYTQGQEGSLEPESAALVCRTGSPFPSVHAKMTPPVVAFFLKIKSTPGGGGRVVVRGTGATESNWRNNVVAVVVPTPPSPPVGGGGGGGGGGNGGDGDGGTLPITGAPAALLAGGGVVAVLLGAGLLLATRRRSSA